MSRAAKPNTLAHYPAWKAAEAATNSVCELVDVLTMAEPIVRASVARIYGRKKR